MAQDANVPCGTCTLCCKSEAIVLHPEDGDNPDLYETIITRHPLYPDRAIFMIKPREDGSTTCRYLGPFGCAVYAKRPVLCRRFDCRKLAARAPQLKAKLDQFGRSADWPAMQKLVDRGNELRAKETP